MTLDITFRMFRQKEKVIKKLRRDVQKHGASLRRAVLEIAVGVDDPGARQALTKLNFQLVEHQLEQKFNNALRVARRKGPDNTGYQHTILICF